MSEADAVLLTEPPLRAGQRRRVLLPFIIVTLIWGSTWLVIRGQLGVVPTAWSIAYRFIIAAVAMLAYARASGVSLRIDRAALPVIAIVAVTQFVLNYQFVYHAEAHITSGVVAMISALLVVPNAVFGRLFLGQGLSRPFLIGSLVALVGIGLLFAHELGAATAGRHDTAIGILLALAGVLAASTANIAQAGDRARRLPLVAMLAWSLTIGAGVNVAYALASAGAPVLDPRPIYWLGLVYLGTVASALAFPLYFGVIRAIGAARAAYSGVILPIIAMSLSTIFEGYRWSAESVIGGLLVFGGLVFALRSRSPAR